MTLAEFAGRLSRVSEADLAADALAGRRHVRCPCGGPNAWWCAMRVDHLSLVCISCGAVARASLASEYRHIGCVHNSSAAFGLSDHVCVYAVFEP